MATDLLRLTAGNLRVEIDPALGGSITAFRWIAGDRTCPVMRSDPDPRNALEASSVALVPFVNRVRGGRFHFRGRDVLLQPNLPGDPSPLHGQGWLAAWDVASAAERRAGLRFVHQAGEWPWAYEARQDFVLDQNGLSLTLTCRNLSPEPMPCGLGQHPYFPCGPETRIDTFVDCAWTINEQVLPVAKVAAEGRYSLENRLVCGQDLDNGFGGWSGHATISDPSWPYDLRLSSPDADYFHVYSPTSGGFFAAEPVTHANAAMNEPEDSWPGLGFQILQPGKEMRLQVRLDVLVKTAER